MLEAVLLWLGDNAAILGAIGALLATLLFIGPSWFKRKQHVKLSQDSIKAISSPSGPKLTIDDFMRIRREIKGDLEADLERAHESEKAKLREQISELERQLDDPDVALAEAEEKIADLSARLLRMGQEIGGDRLAEAEAALMQLDFSVADEIFAEIEARQELAVLEAARAAYGRGEVAEAEMRWNDAAEHYAESGSTEQ